MDKQTSIFDKLITLGIFEEWVKEFYKQHRLSKITNLKDKIKRHSNNHRFINDTLSWHVSVKGHSYWSHQDNRFVRLYTNS